MNTNGIFYKKTLNALVIHHNKSPNNFDLKKIQFFLLKKKKVIY